MQRVLIVDDDRLTADTLGLIFEKRGFEARVVYGVDDALISVKEFAPSLILCDITMPERDGLELMVEVERLELQCSVLVLTGYMSNLKPVQDQTRRMSQRTHVMIKPCPPEDLLRAASAMLLAR